MLKAATDKLNRLKQVDEILRLTSECFDRARTRTARHVADKIEYSIQSRLSGILHNQRFSVAVEPRNLHVSVWEMGSQGKRRAEPSRSTQQLSSVLAPIALGEYIRGPNSEMGPLILDEIASESDPERLCRVLDELLTISNRRQVIVFTKQNPAAPDWVYAKQNAGRQVHLKELAEVAGEPDEDQ